MASRQKEISLFKKFYKRKLKNPKFLGATNFVFTDVESDIQKAELPEKFGG
ncbi:MAG: hypothetical protein IPF93_14285 [Saprospiraceae bacterium]|nr:hypothetical protein [Saprospiraceae bacterium]